MDTSRVARHAGVAAIAAAVLIGVGACESGRAPSAGPSVSPSTVGSPSAGPTGRPVVTEGCLAVRLRVPAGVADGSVGGGDPSGRYLVGGGDGRALIWDDGTPTAHEPLGSRGGYLRDVNSSGHAVGFKRTGTGPAILYRDGQWFQLEGGAGEAYAINESGVIVGLLHSGGDEARPVAWRSATGQPQVLRLPADLPSGEATAIDDDGTIGGFAYRQGFGGRAVVWRPDGTLRDLAGQLPTTSPGGARVISSAVKDLRGGWALITMSDESGTALPARVLNIRTGEIRVLPGGIAGVSAVNASGFVVGFTGDSSVLVTGTETRTLPALADGGSPTPVSLSDDGRTIGGFFSDVPAVVYCA